MGRKWQQEPFWRACWHKVPFSEFLPPPAFSEFCFLEFWYDNWNFILDQEKESSILRMAD